MFVSACEMLNAYIIIDVDGKATREMGFLHMPQIATWVIHINVKVLQNLMHLIQGLKEFKTRLSVCAFCDSMNH